MKIRDVMTTEIQTAEPDDTLDEIAVMMRDQDTGAIPVVEDDELIGIVTDRDIVVRCIAEGSSPSEIAVDEIISGDLETVAPDDDLETAQRIMSEKQIRRLPVVEKGRLVGMVSLGDLAVKADQDEAVGDTLENVSEGVKATDQGPAKQRGGARPAAHGQSDKSAKGSRSARGGRQETLEHAGRQQQSMRGRIEEDSQGIVDRSQRADDRAQGITSHAASEEVTRQNRVVPIRSQQRTNVRGERRSKKPSNRKAS
jgi:CBS domain-containing protein